MSPDKPNIQDKVALEIGLLTESVRNMIASFKQIQGPLRESSEQVPKATRKLDEISEQTEVVTHRMLDSVEKITHREEDVLVGLDELSTALPPEMSERARQLIDNLKDNANQNLSDVSQILESLQFQDITAQQLNHAAALLEDIETKLVGLLELTGGTDLVPSSTREPRSRAYDPEAAMAGAKTDQEQIDSLFYRRD